MLTLTGVVLDAGEDDDGDGVALVLDPLEHVDRADRLLALARPDLEEGALGVEPVVLYE